MILGYIARDQYGKTICLIDPKKSPRKQLMEKECVKSCRKMYCDDLQGNTKHIGYIIRGIWYTIYEVHEWKGN